jgi:peptidoglycan/LPS O-acetylase OafA/YrhL
MARQIDNLTGLRAFAALSVVLLHLRYGPAADHYGPLAFLFHNEGVGVFVFFVLSGFILAYVHSRDFAHELSSSNALAFYWARLARIYPVHLVTLIFAGLVLPTIGFAERGPSDTLGMLVANLALVHSWNVTSDYTFNQVSWTISAEWMAYLCFPLIAYFSRNWKPAGFILLAVCNIIALRYLRLTGLKFGAGCVFYFTVGFCAYRAGEALPKLSPRFWTFSAYAMTAVAILFLWLRTVFPLLPQTFSVAASTSALLILCLFKAPPTLLFANPLSEYLGRVSYSIYMSHVLTVTALRAAVGGVQPLWLEILVIVAVSAALYHCVEQPARAALRALWLRRHFAGLA